MTTEDLIDMAQVIIQAIQSGADEYDIAKQLNKLHGAGVSEGIRSMSEALVK
jgi:hypothetical protein